MKLKPRDFSLQEAASSLGISRFSLIRALEQLQMLETNTQFGPSPTASARNQGLLRLSSRSTTLSNGMAKHYQCTRVTIQGLAWIEQKLQEPAQAA